MASEREQLEIAIAALESQRTLIGDAVAEAALTPLQARLAALDETPVPAQTLRQVTILFLDVVGSTALAQHLDAEDMHALIDGALAHCTAIVEAHRGKVLQYAGDNLLAVFGAETAREDDAERAVHAGLALLSHGRDYGEQLALAHGHAGFNVRVGLHTGSVLLGGGVGAEHNIRGSAVHVAARMEQTAPPGGLRISHDTYRHVRGVFDVEMQAPLAIKGLDEPVATYLVQGAKPRAFRVATRGIEGVETHMIGRDAELEQLQDAFRRVVREGKLFSVTVVAEAGLGKSRLLYEFENWAEARPEPFYIFQGRAHPQTQSQPYGLLRDVLAWRLQIADSDSLASARHKLEVGIAPLFEPDDGAEMAQSHAHVLGHLIGFDFAESRHIRGIRDNVQQIRNRGFHAAAQLLRRTAEQNATPVVLLLDDLHYADDGSLDFLNYLLQVNRDVPMLVLGLTRPALFERRTDPLGTQGSHQRIELVPLDKGVSRLLANELLKKLAEIPSALRELISGGAEGNPFYMEELVKMLIDEGAIRTGAQGWSVVPDKLVATHVPQTLTGVLQARIDGLQPAEKLALQQASVIGFVFWDQALAAIDAASPGQLPGLAQRELAIPHHETALEGLREYAFKHQILHHVTYETVLKRMRREFHAKVAAWLAGQSGARLNNLLGATAEHFEQAGDTEQACEFFTRAAEHARDRYAHEAARGYLARALALTDRVTAAPTTEQVRHLRGLRWRLLDVRERLFDLQGQREAQRADIEALQQLADALDDDRRRGEVAWRRCDIAMRTADYRAQESAARQAMAFALRSGDEMLRLRAQQRLVFALFDLGDPAAGKALAHEGLAAARSLGHRVGEALFLHALSFIAYLQDDPVLALALGEQLLPIDREIGDRLSEAVTLGNLGSWWLTLGESNQARLHLEEAWRLMRAVGDRAGEPYPLTSLSKLALRQGADAQALAQAQAALDLAVAVQDPLIEAIALARLGDAELALGRLDEAAAAFQRQHSVALTIDSPWRYDAAAGMARVALARGDVAGAMRTVESVLDHLAGGGTSST
jgi:class 3 adenylate cyclase/tetratricopeptide (TPR) repeat protein